MVSTGSPPVPLPVQVPPGHVLQQIVDERGTLRHVILSPAPAAAAAAAVAAVAAAGHQPTTGTATSASSTGPVGVLPLATPSHPPPPPPHYVSIDLFSLGLSILVVPPQTHSYYSRCDGGYLWTCGRWMTSRQVQLSITRLVGRLFGQVAPTIWSLIQMISHQLEFFLDWLDCFPSIWIEVFILRDNSFLALSSVTGNVYKLLVKIQLKVGRNIPADDVRRKKIVAHENWIVCNDDILILGWFIIIRIIILIVVFSYLRKSLDDS